MKRLIVLLIWTLLPISITAQTWDMVGPDTVIVSDSADSLIFHIWVYDGDDVGLVVEQDYRRVGELGFYSVVRVAKDSSGYHLEPLIVVRPMPEPGDMNGDGSVGMGDLWLLFGKILKLW